MYKQFIIYNSHINSEDEWYQNVNPPAYH
jgi:hypothetical protein